MDNKTNKKRLIIDAKKLTSELVALVKEKYPEGYYEDDIILFKNQYNETAEAIQVEDENAIYLIKISKQLNVELESFDDPIDMDDTPSVPKDIDEIDGVDDEEEEEQDDRPKEDEEEGEESEADEEDGEEDDGERKK